MKTIRIIFILSVAILALGYCTTRQQAPIVIEEVSMGGTTELPGPSRLSEWNLFEGGDLSRLVPLQGMVPYDLNTPLFTDYASKMRFVKLPESQKATYSQEDVLGFPEGTILVKNFYYTGDQLVNSDERYLVETRLLIHQPDGWQALTYVWNEEQTEAFLEIAGTTRRLAILKKNGERISFDYSVPNLVQCKSCHEKNGEMTPIGPSVRQLNRDFRYSDGRIVNQIDHWQELGMLNGVPDGDLPRLPEWDDTASGTLAQRARAWLEINCAHCHIPEGPAKNSGLYLSYNVSDPYQLGIFKPPVAAGRGSAGMQYGIVPGRPEESFLVYRIASTDPGVMMPELGRKLVHEEGVALVSDWIRSLDR